MDTTVKFENLDYGMMSIYLFLVLGREGMSKHDMQFIPQKKEKSDSSSRSLLSKVNRVKNNWLTNEGKFTAEEKRIMLALTTQIGSLVLMATSCYSFGGKIYQQLAGSGIGLRALACSAKIVMGYWDMGWCALQEKLGLKVQLFLR